MQLEMLKCKIHRATITEANLHYAGSLTVDRDLMDAAGLLPYEKVLVANVNTGERLETYVIEGESGSGVMCLNGAAARLGQAGDIVIVICFALMDTEEAKTFKPRTVYVDGTNKITHIVDGT